MTPPLSVRMRAAADTLEEASELYDAYDPAGYEWSAFSLRHEAGHVADEEAESE